MSHLYKTLAVLFVLSLSLSSCKTSKQLSGSKNKKLPVDSLLLAFEKNQPQFEWFSAKARVNYKDKSISKSFTAAIRMRKDSIIWISVTTMLGVEAARLLIRNDSVFFIDRLNKIYNHEPLSYLEQFVSFPFTIGMLQKILTGSALFELSERDKLKEEKGGVSLFFDNNQYKYVLNIANENRTISTEYLTDIQSNRSISLVFEDYVSENERLFSYSRNISIKAHEPIELSLKFSKVKWNEPVSFPFQVGEKYQEE